jgi:hypothetical protein
MQCHLLGLIEPIKFITNKHYASPFKQYGLYCCVLLLKTLRFHHLDLVAFTFLLDLPITMSKINNIIQDVFVDVLTEFNSLCIGQLESL